MPFIAFNPNPKAKRVGDCSVRAICKALDQDWDTSFLELAIIAMREYDMPSANYIWGLLLQQKGFSIRSLPVICPHCSTVEEFCQDHPKGTFVLVCDGEHVVTAIDGCWYDTWDSGDSVVLYFYEKQEE